MNNILVVESEPWLAEHYQKGLEDAGFEVYKASNGYSAIDIIDERHPVAIVMGLMLDGPGAVSLLHELQSYTDTAAIPVILCTNVPNLDEQVLDAYGVVTVIDSTAVKPGDIAAAVKSAIA